jgi:GNAT superfamily N-acetyltransferase
VSEVALRFDKNFSLDMWLELYRSARYNEWWTDRNAEVARAYAHLVVTAWIDESMVGTLSVWSDGLNFALLDDVVIGPLHQREGIGSRLVKAAIERLCESVKIIQVLPIPGAEAFYERLGFVVQPEATVMDLVPPTNA